MVVIGEAPPVMLARGHGGLGDIGEKSSFGRSCAKLTTSH